jgi:hypothetical protein
MPMDESTIDKDEIDGRRPQPFRYLQSEEEIRDELKLEKTPHFSVMKLSKEAQRAMDNGLLADMDNKEKIEKIIQKHRKIMENRKESLQ